MRKILNSLCPILFLLTGIVFPTYASHLMGGNLAYKYLGSVGGGMYSYKITLTLYTNCDSTSEVPVPESTANIGVYEETANPSDPKPAYAPYNNIAMPLVDSLPITPNAPNGCTFGIGTCIYKGVYIDTISLPEMINGTLSKGYYLYYDRCCRNGGVLNLNAPGATGMAFMAYIPPPIIPNSSPVFTNNPVPFICANDTTGILNTATDPDGDLLIFSFEDPYAGLSSQANPNIFLTNPPNPLTWPIPTVSWAAGYSKNAPFGPNGYAYINSFTGYTKYMSPANGKYVVAVEVKEYRNNNLIGISSLDLELIVLNCPPNIAPVFNSSNQQPSYSIEEGQQLCFPINFNDPNNDSIKLTSSGNIFDTTFTNPPATITTPDSGSGSASAQFCWPTACGQAQSLPYLFTVYAQDNGCPPKMTPIVYSITVNPFQGPSSINGPASVCAQTASSSYSVPNIPGATYNWTVTNGSIISGNGTDSINVNWGNASSGTVSVTTTSQYGCVSGPINLAVNMTSAQINAGRDTTICPGANVQLGGSPTAPAGYSLSWSPSGSLNSANVSNPVASPTVPTTYIVTASGGACDFTDTVTVNLFSNSISVIPNTSICTNDSVHLNAQGGATYSWMPGSGLSDSTIADPWASPSATTTYTVNVTSASGCSALDSTTVTVNAIPAINAGNDTSICYGSDVVIGGSPTGPSGATYAWSPAGSLSSSSVANPVASPLDTTTYQLMLTDSNGCSRTDSVIVVVNPAPTLNAGADTAICMGDSVQLNASGSGSFLWSPGQTLNTDTIYNPIADPTSTTVYYVSITNASGCKNIDSLQVTVHPLPLINAGPDVWLCPGDSTQLQANGGSTYAWSPGTSLSDSTIANPWSAPADTTTYIVTATDIYACKNKDTISVYVGQHVPTHAGNNQTICFGDSVQLGGAPTAPQGSNYNWSPSTGLSDPTVSNPLASPAVTTVYHLYTSNDTCSGQDSVQVIVHSLPTVSAGNNVGVCVGDSTQLQASGGTQYLWTPAATLNNDSIANPWANPQATTNYMVTATDSFGCKNSDTVQVAVNALPVANAGNNAAICYGDSIQLQASGGSSYSWGPAAFLNSDSIADPYATPLATTNFYVNVTDSNGCKNSDTVMVTVHALPSANAGNNGSYCQGDSVQLHATGGTSYHWYPSQGLSDSTIADPWVSISASTTYTVQVTDSNACSADDSVKVIVNLAPNVNAGPDKGACIGDSVQIGGIPTGPANSYFMWSPSVNLNNDTTANPVVHVLNSISYYVTVIDSNGCQSSDTVNVFAYPMPQVNAGGNVYACLDSATALGGNPTGPPGATYQWTPSGGVNYPDSANPMAVSNANTTYYVTVTDTNGCVSKDSTFVHVFSILAAPDTSGCIGDSIALSVNVYSGNSPYSYAWSPNIGIGNSTSASPNVAPAYTTTYTVMVTDGNGCVATGNTTVFINAEPHADFTALGKPSCDGMEMDFTNTSQNSTSYEWLFGDGSTSTEVNPVHVFSYGQSFSVALVAYNGNCTDTLWLTENIKSFTDYVHINIPNVFTPNGDGINDVFGISGLDANLSGCTELKVFDRWGVKEYDSQGSMQGWDGRTSAGRDVPAGTYFYELKINDITLKGHVTLLR